MIICRAQRALAALPLLLLLFLPRYSPSSLTHAFVRNPAPSIRHPQRKAEDATHAWCRVGRGNRRLLSLFPAKGASREGIATRTALDDGETENRGDCWPVGDGYEVRVLSEDPRVYIVDGLLSPEECRSYIDYASSLSSESEGEDVGRTMTRSNAPEVSLDASRLWPLPFLCLGAGLPPLVRIFESLPDGASPPPPSEIAAACLPPVAIAAAATAALTAGVTALIRARAEGSSRTSDAVSLNEDCDVEFVRPLVERASAIGGGHAPASFEAPVVTRYSPGAVFSVHNDASPTRGSEWSDLGGQRVVTVITYLNDCPLGGGTRFDRLGVTVQPKQGSALVFYPADRITLDADDRTRHESLPAVEEKWIVQMFGREGARVPPPLGLPNSFFPQ